MRRDPYRRCTSIASVLGCAVVLAFAGYFTASNASGDGYMDALEITNTMSSDSGDGLQKLVAAQERGQITEAAQYSFKVAKYMKSQQDRVWQVFTHTPTIAVAALYEASVELTELWLAELAAFQFMAKGLDDQAQLSFDKSALAAKSYYALLERASLAYQGGL